MEVKLEDTVYLLKVHQRRISVLRDKVRLSHRIAKLSDASLSFYKTNSATKNEAVLLYRVEDLLNAEKCADFYNTKKHWLNVILPNDTSISIGYETEEKCYTWLKAIKSCKIARKLSTWVKDPATIQKGSLLGTGAYGKVWKGKMSGTPVAIKEMFAKGDSSDDIIGEILLLGMIHNPYCVRLLGIYTEPPNQQKFNLITELVDEGDLACVLERYPRKLSELTKLKILRDVARGLLFLHENGVIHRDVKTDNCLIRSVHPDAAQFAVIADFGISKIAVQLGEAGSNTMGKGTPIYMAPECFSSYTAKVDVYSFGVVINEVFSEERPWEHVPTKFSSAILDRVEKGERPLQNFSQTDYPHADRVKTIINACWTHDHKLRPDMKTILAEIENLIEEISAPNAPVQSMSTGSMPSYLSGSLPAASNAAPKVAPSYLTALPSFEAPGQHKPPPSYDEVVRPSIYSTVPVTGGNAPAWRSTSEPGDKSISRPGYLTGLESPKNASAEQPGYLQGLNAYNTTK